MTRFLAEKLAAWGRHCLLALLLFGLSAPAAAAIEISFYSRELGQEFPHAFFTLRGTIDATGERVEAGYGFTAKAVTPAILFGSVGGEVVSEGDRQVRQSERQFAVILTDAQYGAVLEVVERWRNRPQPSYNMNRRNCVHFVGEVAQAIGLNVTFERGLMKRPRSFLQHVRSLNPQLSAAAP